MNQACRRIGARRSESSGEMLVSISEFWKLAVDSGLLTTQQCQGLGQQFGGVKGAELQGNARTLSEWLISEQSITRFQADILLDGHAGPFYYGDYKIGERVQLGELVNTYSAQHLPTGHPVFVQFLTGAPTQDAASWSRTAQRLWERKKLDHAHLIKLHEIVDLDSFKFVVYERVDGAPLSQFGHNGARLSVEEACRSVYCAAQGLAEIHRSGNLHGRIGTRSIWRSGSGDVWLVDDPLYQPQPANVSAMDDSESSTTRADYAAPELGRPGVLPTPLTDVYALGCTLYELLAGQVPFPGGDHRQKLVRHANEPIQPLDQWSVPPQIGQVVAYMMAKSPDVRISSAEGVLDALRPCLDPTLLSPHTDPVVPTRIAYDESIRARHAAVANAGQAQLQSYLAPIHGGAQEFSAVDTSVARFARTSRGVDGRTHGVAAPQGPLSDQRTTPTRNSVTGWTISLAVAGCMLAAAVVYVAVSARDAGDSTDQGQVGQINGGPNLPTPDDGGQDPGDDPGDDDPGDDEPEGGVPTDGGNPTGTDGGRPGGRQTIVPDDGRLLWSSPTDGDQISLGYVPSDAHLYIIVRAAALVSSDEGQKILRALGPDFDAARKSWAATAGIGLGDVERMIVAFHSNDGLTPRTSVVISLADKTTDDLVANWGPATSTGAGQTYQASEWSIFVPDSGQRRLFVMGSRQDIEDVVLNDNSPPLLRREMNWLWQSSDAQRHVSILFEPSFLYGDGLPLFAGQRRKALDALGNFLGDGIQAVTLSMHVDRGLFWELRIAGQLDRNPYELASQYRDKLEQLHGHVLDYIASLDTPLYWRKLAIQFPPMIGELYRHARIGFEGDQAIVNGALPLNAAHNLVLGTELAIHSVPGADVGGGPPMQKMTLPQVLDEHRLTLNIPQQSLEFSIRDLAAEVNNGVSNLQSPFAIRIIGPDLQLDGITRNQQIKDFSVSGATVAETLTLLVMKANPVTTVTDPAELDQKLIWVVAADPDQPEGPAIVLITTRTAAETKGYSLPDVFRPN